jgi:anhydro-N-acetylmuramic acid kinase
LMDHWCQRHQRRRRCAAGAWAATGQVLPTLLSALLAEPFFALPPPKSTGRDLFHPAWLTAKLAAALATDASPADVQATLLELTARSCVDALLRHAPTTQALLVCGGGALNGQLMRRLQALLPQASVQPTDARGLPAMQVEAAAFAWLAQACVTRQAGNLVSVTGAQGPRVLGSITPA